MTRKFLISILFVLLAFGSVLAQNTTTTSLNFIWNSNSETDLAGYGFYTDLNGDKVYDRWEDDINPSGSSEVVFRAEGVVVNINEPTYFAVDAFNTAGERSGYSEPCSYIHCVPLPEETQSIPCETGYTGEKTQKRTSSCSFNSYPTWSAWVDVSNTCVALQTCIPLAPETRTISCPSGYTGSITETRTSSCPSQYGSPVWGEWVQTSSTCTAISTCVSQTQTRTIRCTKWYEKGSITQQRTLICRADGTSYWTAWATISSTCRPWWKR